MTRVRGISSNNTEVMCKSGNGLVEYLQKMIRGVYHGPKLQQSSPISVEKHEALSGRMQYLFIPHNKNKGNPYMRHCTNSHDKGIRPMFCKRKRLNSSCFAHFLWGLQKKLNKEHPKRSMDHTLLFIMDNLLDQMNRHTIKSINFFIHVFFTQTSFAIYHC